MMRDKLVKASFPASLGKALTVKTHHRSRCQDLLCCKSKPETFQLNMCLWRSTCSDRRKEIEKALCLGSISTHLQTSTFSTTATAQLLNRRGTGYSTRRSYCTVRLFLFGSWFWLRFSFRRNKMCFDIGIVTCGPNEALVVSGMGYGEINEDTKEYRPYVVMGDIITIIHNKWLNGCIFLICSSTSI